MAEAPVLVYDGECPVCTRYVRWTRLREAVGTPELVDARNGGELVERLQRNGHDLDEGMVLLYGGQVHHGADALQHLALLTTPSGLFNRLSALLFRHPRVARLAYPVLRAGRNTLLRLLGRKRINADG